MQQLIKSISSLSAADQNLVALTLVASLIFCTIICVDLIVESRFNGK